MKLYQTPVFDEAPLDELHDRVAEFKANGYTFVQICATLRESSCELLYAFQDTTYESGGLNGLMVDVPDGAAVPSITDLYPAAFVFENETHDLFGVNLEGISIDFDGEFYTVAVAYPMNPRAAEAAAAAAEPAPAVAEGEEADNE